MLLEDERSISIPFGVLYYIGSKRRVEVPFNDELRAKTLQAIRSIRELSLLDAPAAAAADRVATSVFRLLPGNNLPAGRNALLPRTPNLMPAEESAAGITRVLPQGSEGAVLYLQEQVPTSASAASISSSRSTARKFNAFRS